MRIGDSFERARRLALRQRGRGEEGASSDIDVAVVLDEGRLDQEVEAIREQLAPTEAELGIRVSLVPIGVEDVRRLSSGDSWWSPSCVTPLPSPDLIRRV